MSTRTNPAAGTTPMFDLRKLFEGIDVPEAGRKFFEAQRKDLEALVQANREAFQALQTLGRRQQEILQAAAKAWQQGFKDVMAAPKLGDKAGTAARNSQKAFAQAIADLKEMASLAVTSNKKALAPISARVKARVAEITPRVKQVAEKAAAPKAPIKRRAAPARKRRTAA